MASITLTDRELALAAQIGINRNLESIKMRSDHADGTNKKPQIEWGNHVQGAIAEYAVSLYFNLAWTAIEKINSVDVGHFIEVKYTATPENGLPIRPKESSADFPWILVTGKHYTYELIGWYKPSLGLQDEWKNQFRSYYVPRSNLRSMESFVETFEKRIALARLRIARNH